MQSVTSNAVSKCLSSNETEVDTGGKWIDGKELYKKCFNFGSLPNTSAQSKAHNLNNVKIVRVYGIALTSFYSIPMPHISLGGYSIELYATTRDIVISTQGNLSNYTGYVILEYTKS